MLTNEEMRSDRYLVAANLKKEDLLNATCALAWTLLEILKEAAPHDYNTYKLSAMYDHHERYGFDHETAVMFAADVQDALYLVRGH